jgi:hypothetical protein
MEATFDAISEEISRSVTRPFGRRQLGCRLDVRSTVVAVDLELGLNNAVFIRGHGGGLSWGRGQPLIYFGHGRWIWSASPCEERIEFGLLLDDQVWARGEKIVLDPGRTIEVTADFEWPEIPRVAMDSSDVRTRRSG